MKEIMLPMHLETTLFLVLIRTEISRDAQRACAMCLAGTLYFKAFYTVNSLPFFILRTRNMNFKNHRELIVKHRAKLLVSIVSKIFARMRSHPDGVS